MDIQVSTIHTYAVTYINITDSITMFALNMWNEMGKGIYGLVLLQSNYTVRGGNVLDTDVCRERGDWMAIRLG